MWHSANLRTGRGWIYLWLVVASVAVCMAGSRAVPLVAAPPAVLPEPPVLISPPNGSELCNPAPIFLWDRVRGADTYRIQIDDDRRFGSPIIDQTIASTSFVPGSGLPVGTWYWRVRGANEELTGEWSEPWSLTVLALGAPPSLLSPEEGAQICDRMPVLSWTAVDGATSYRVQVDDGPGFLLPLLDVTTADVSYAFSTALASGTYYWRVRASNDCGNSDWSDLSSFVIPDRPRAPVLIAPLDGATIQERFPTFAWHSVNVAVSYRIQVDDDRRFETPLVDGESSSTSFVPSIGLPNGTYYWRVQAASDCQPGEWSDPWRVTVSNQAPIARDDQFSVDEDSPDRELDVLANDDDPDEDALSIVDVTQPLYGSVSIASSNVFLIYRPDPDYFGEDSFTYTVGDGHGDTDVGRVELTVIGLSDPPVADAGPAQSVPMSALVTLDGSRSYDPDGDLPLSYFWTQSGGPPVALSSGVVVSPTFVAPSEPCTLRFELLVRDARGEASATPAQTVVTVYEPVITYVYVPVLVHEYAFAPDLMIQRIDANSDDVRVVIVNQGNGRAVNGFFVDLYINPRSAPVRVNQTWDQLGTEGMVWGVTEPALLSLVPGGSITLEVGDAYYRADLSEFTGLMPVGTVVYAQVDSFNPATAYGTVLEGHEISGETYNNVYGPVRSTAR